MTLWIFKGITMIKKFALLLVVVLFSVFAMATPYPKPYYDPSTIVEILAAAVENILMDCDGGCRGGGYQAPPPPPPPPPPEEDECQYLAVIVCPSDDD